MNSIFCVYSGTGIVQISDMVLSLFQNKCKRRSSWQNCFLSTCAATINTKLKFIGGALSEKMRWRWKTLYFGVLTILWYFIGSIINCEKICCSWTPPHKIRLLIWNMGHFQRLNQWFSFYSVGDQCHFADVCYLSACLTISPRDASPFSFSDGFI